MPDIKPLPKSPILPTSLDADGKNLIKALYDHILKSNTTVNELIKKVNQLP